MGVLDTKSGGGRFAALLGGIGLGAAVMYVLDPQGGRRRRALARDKALSFANTTSRVVGARSRDLANRAKGVAAQARSKMTEGTGGSGNYGEPTGENRQRETDHRDEGSF
ncbi:MAG: YtxH domain-containing protein [Acidobacteriota bacterium]|nr:YtxH domain-containing protein [Acidobacteriota bacterium]